MSQDEPPRAARGGALSLFAATAPGLEPLAAAELRALGIEARVEPGGASFSGTIEDVYRANLWLRTASRVIARVGEFNARALGELERRARQQPWERFLTPGAPLQLRVTCKKSRLYHTGAVAERVAEAIEARIGGAVEARAAAPDEAEGEDDAGGAATPLVIVRFLRDVCTLSVDSSGDLLHLRGYRLATAKAPMRETLAAGLLMASGWDTAAPLLDPMCGAGTIVIEAVLMARRIAPGLLRDRSDGSPPAFAFAGWPEFDARRWRARAGDARGRALHAAPARIAGSDRDAGAIAAAVSNAERAGVAADVELSVRSLSGIEPGPTPGWLVTNPPYGVRVGERDRLRNLYAQLGNVARRRCVGWTVALLSADEQLARATGMRLDTV
ncbi:MAG: hypothetical protein WKG32_12130, partial [Gemmatimonadaceae bacterium]